MLICSLCNITVFCFFLFKMSHLNVNIEFVGTEGNKTEGMKQYITVSAPKEVLSIEGEHLNYLKTRKSDGRRVEFVFDERNAFEGWTENSSSHFWLPSEEVELLMSIIGHVRTPKKLLPHLESFAHAPDQTYLVNAMRVSGIMEVLFTELACPFYSF